MTLNIRPAQTFDADFAAPLIAQTIGAVGWHLTGTDNDNDAAHVLGQFFVLRGNRHSFIHTLIAEENGRPVGVAVLYPGELSSALDDPFRAHRRMLGLSPDVTSEGQAGELYLDTLALVPEVRGRGYGGQMLDACARRAADMGLPLALVVEDGNPASRLYARSGFHPAERLELAGHWYTRMLRQGGAAELKGH